MGPQVSDLSSAKTTIYVYFFVCSKFSKFCFKKLFYMKGDVKLEVSLHNSLEGSLISCALGEVERQDLV